MERAMGIELHPKLLSLTAFLHTSTCDNVSALNMLEMVTDE